MRFLFTCGGTAGHINPAVAVASALQDRCPGSEVLFIGAEGKMEMELVPKEGYEIRPVKITNLSRGHSLSAISHNLDTVKNVLHSTAEARKIIREFKPDVVIGTGGYVCSRAMQVPGLRRSFSRVMWTGSWSGWRAVAVPIQILPAWKLPALRYAARFPVTPGLLPVKNSGFPWRISWFSRSGAPWVQVI